MEQGIPKQPQHSVGGGDSSDVDPVAQEINERRTKDTFLGVDDEAVLSQAGKNLPEMTAMICLVLAGQLQVILICKAILNMMLDTVNLPLEGIARIAQPAFSTMCKGEDKVLSERRTRRSRSKFSNSALAIASFALLRRHNLEKIGGPVLFIWWKMSLVAGRGGSVPDGLTSANSSSNAFIQTEKLLLLDSATEGCAAAIGLLSGPAMVQNSGPALAGPALAERQQRRIDNCGQCRDRGRRAGWFGTFIN